MTATNEPTPPQGPFACVWTQRGTLVTSDADIFPVDSWTDAVEMLMEKLAEVREGSDDNKDLLLLMWQGSSREAVKLTEPEFVGFYKEPNIVAVVDGSQYLATGDLAPFSFRVPEEAGVEGNIVTSDPGDMSARQEDHPEVSPDSAQTIGHRDQPSPLVLTDVSYEDHEDGISEDDRDLMDELRELREHYTSEQKSFFRESRVATFALSLMEKDDEGNILRAIDSEHRFDSSLYEVFYAAKKTEAITVQWVFPHIEAAQKRILTEMKLDDRVWDYIRKNAFVREDGMFQADVLFVAAFDDDHMNEQEAQIIAGVMPPTSRTDTTRTLSKEDWDHLNHLIIVPAVSEEAIRLAPFEIDMPGVHPVDPDELVDFYRELDRFSELERRDHEAEESEYGFEHDEEGFEEDYGYEEDDEIDFFNDVSAEDITAVIHKYLGTPQAFRAENSGNSPVENSPVENSEEDTGETERDDHRHDRGPYSDD